MRVTAPTGVFTGQRAPLGGFFLRFLCDQETSCQRVGTELNNATLPPSIYDTRVVRV